MATSSRSAVRRLAVARLISLSGGAAAFMALNFTIYQRTGSAVWVAAALFLTFGTIGFVSPFAGALGDRFDRRKVMIASDLAAAAFFFAMAMAHTPSLLLVFAFLSAAAEAPFMSASTAAIPNLVAEEDLGWANGLVALGRNAGIVVGPLLGGLLVATVGPGAAFAANAVTFLVSAALVASVRARFNEDRHPDDEHQGFKAGFRFIRHDRILRAIAMAWVGVVLGLGMTMVADVPLVELFSAGSLGYGALIACWGGGSIIGSLAGRYLTARNESNVFLIGTVAVAATSIAVGLSPWFAFVLGAIAAMGIGDGAAMVSAQGIMLRRTPDSVRSRVSAAYDTILHIGMAISYVVAGPAVAWLGAKGVYVVGGGIALLGAAVALPVLWRWSGGTQAEGTRDGGPAATEPASLLVP